MLKQLNKLNRTCSITILFLIVLLITISSCTKPEENNKPNADTSTNLVEEKLEESKFTCNGKLSFEGSLISIFIDEQTYAALEPKIKRYQEDIKNDLCSEVELITVTSTDTAESIHTKLVSKLNEQKLIGAIFIGDIPYKRLGVSKTETWPSTEYYSELDTKFLDKGTHLIRDRENQGTSRTIWIGVMLPPNFHKDKASGITMLSNYFDRNHAYRTGTTTYEKKVLYYNLVESGDSDKSIGMIPNYGRYMQKDIIVPANYLQSLQESFELAFIFAHGSSIMHEPDITSDKIQAIDPKGIFYVIFGCEVGSFDTENYLGGEYLFSGNGLVVHASQAKIFTATGVNHMSFLEHLQNAQFFGQIFNTVLGDPTLRMQIEYIPDVKASYNEEVDLGTLIPSLTFEKKGTIEITNKGKEVLIIHDTALVPDVLSYNAKFPTHLQTGETFVFDYTIFGTNLQPVTTEYTKLLQFKTNQPYENKININMKYKIDATGIEFECIDYSNNSLLCDKENYYTAYSGDCNKINGNKMCKGVKLDSLRSDCVKTYYYDIKGTEPYLEYDLINKKEGIDCDAEYTGTGRIFYVTTTCCTMWPKT